MVDIDEAVERAILTKSQIYNRKDNCPDDQRDAELRNLYRLADMAPDGAAVEIGVRTGGSFLCWSCAREGRGNLYAVDDWSSKTERLFWDNCRLFNVPVSIVGMKSSEAAKHITEPIAFLFVDGNHDWGILEDVRVWPDKMMPAGILVFHDYGVWKPTVRVKAAVDEWQARDPWEFLGLVGSSIAYRKPSEAHHVDG